MARVSEEIGFGTVLTRVADFWNKNFSWTSGKYSPKNILEKKEDKAEGREYRKLEDPMDEPAVAPTSLKVSNMILARHHPHNFETIFNHLPDTFQTPFRHL